MSESIDHVIERFGDQERVNRRLHRDDPDFRELCDDYRDVLDALGDDRSRSRRAGAAQG